MAHDGELVERRLPVEQDHVAVFHVAFHDVPDAQRLGGALAVAEGERLDEGLPLPAGPDEVGARVDVGPVADPLPQLVEVVAGHPLWGEGTAKRDDGTGGRGGRGVGRRDAATRRDAAGTRGGLPGYVMTFATCTGTPT